MSDQHARTRYRVGQHWRFRSDIPEARDILLIQGVEEHPARGIVCQVWFAYDPPLEAHPGSFATGGEYWVTQAAMDRSVTELAAEAPRGSAAGGEFRRGRAFWAEDGFPGVEDRTVGE